MPARPPVRRVAVRRVLAALSAIAVPAAAGAVIAIWPRGASAGQGLQDTGMSRLIGQQMPERGQVPSVADPYSPAYRHSYREGVLPVVGRLARMRAWASRHPSGARAIFPPDLRYGGGIDGIGVTTGPEKVYLVFWGSQWGTKRTGSHADLTLSGDPSGEAPYLQQLFTGIGTGSETWSGVMTQYCQGVAAGATSCPAGNRFHVAYPAGGALAGVWADERSPAPGHATGHQLGAEAVAAAAHFGNTTATSNRDAQYVILSPAGTHPDGFNTPSGNFCAWHDWNADTTLTGGPVRSAYGDVAFTNMPYITDAGRACGENFVNAGQAGLLDGVSLVNGHEYAETITDQNPAGGWMNPGGDEAADLCAWNSGPGAKSANLTLPTGTFAMPPIWANNAGTCELSHAIVANGGGTGGGGTGGGGKHTVTVASPGRRRAFLGSDVRLRIRASDSAAGQALSYAGTGLPPGLRIRASTGLISGRPTAVGAYRVKVTATDRAGARASTIFRWAVVRRGFFAGAGWMARQPAWLSLWGCAESRQPCLTRAWSWRSSSSAAPVTARAAGSRAWRARPGPS